MSNMKSKNTNEPVSYASQVIQYLETKGKYEFEHSQGVFKITQKLDKKTFKFDESQLTEVLSRKDAEGKSFLQLNFKSSAKVLITENLIGFKPTPIVGLDMSRLPKVVTTPDLISITSAIEENLNVETFSSELEILKKVYFAVLLGAESVGISLPAERRWYLGLTATALKACA
ncbi:MAG: hypothetical protein V4736_13630 [Bdellovibrionota bacterium]